MFNHYKPKIILFVLFFCLTGFSLINNGPSLSQNMEIQELFIHPIPVPSYPSTIYVPMIANGESFVTIRTAANPTNLASSGGQVEFTIEITNNLSTPVSLNSLTSSLFGDLDKDSPASAHTWSSSTCDSGGMVDGGGVTLCKFTGLFNAGPGLFGNWVSALTTNAGKTSHSIHEAVVEVRESSELEVLAAQFAPVLKFDQSASSYPMDAEKYWDEMLCGERGGPLPTNYEGCVQHIYTWGNGSLGSLTQGTTEFSTLRQYFNKVPTYFKAQKNETTNQVRIEYWWFYGYQQKCAAWQCIIGEIKDGKECDHPSDWEHIMVTLSQDQTHAVSVTFYQHGGWYTRHAWNVNFVEKHPVIYVGKTQHGSYHNSGGNGGCLYYDDFRNPSASSFWNTWESPLVNLDGNEQDWLAYDRQAGFKWHGSGGVSTHPTRYTANFFDVRACNGKQAADLGDAGCMGDNSNCKPGHHWCWTYVCAPTSLLCLDPDKNYNKDFYISTSDGYLNSFPPSFLP